MTRQPKPVAKIITPITDTLVLSYAADLTGLDGQIKELQNAKKRVYEALREDHGKQAAKALKAAVTIHSMDSEKRQQAEDIDTEAFRMLGIIETGTTLANSDDAHVARGAHEADHDPDTGEIIEPAEHPAADADGQTLSSDAGSSAPIQPETADSTQPQGQSGTMPNDGGEDVAAHDELLDTHSDVALAGEGRGADSVALGSDVEPVAPSNIIPIPLVTGGTSIRHHGPVA